MNTVLENTHLSSPYVLEQQVGYAASRASDNVQEQLKKLLTKQIESKYADGYWLYEAPYIGFRDTPDSIANTTVLGKKYERAYNKIKALDRFVLSGEDKGFFKSLEYVNRVITFGGEHSLPSIKNIKEINGNGAEGEVTILTLPDGATIEKISPSHNRKTALNLNGKVK